ncbi:MAG: hypothetical protein ACYCSF_06890 [Acidimicrobiales bacterium]
MKASPPEVFGVSSGVPRTFANIGVVFSFVVAILVASLSISKHLASAIFVGTTTLHGHVAVAFTTGLLAVFSASMGFMASPPYSRHQGVAVRPWCPRRRCKASPWWGAPTVPISLRRALCAQGRTIFQHTSTASKPAHLRNVIWGQGDDLPGLPARALKKPQLRRRALGSMFSSAATRDSQT